MTQCVQGMIFDFDGTLAHLTLDFGIMRQRAFAAARSAIDSSSSPNWLKASTSVISSMSLPEDDGRPVLEWLALAHSHIAPHCIITADAMMTAAHTAIEDVEIEAATRGALFSWTRTMLTVLGNRGIPVAIITRNCRKAVLAVFPDVLEYSRCLLTREDVPNVKPHPDHLRQALLHINCAPQYCIMVGDHPMDIETGKAGGTLTAGVASGNTPQHVLAASQPDYLATDCMDLYEQLSCGW